jgi:hypothetical protein
MSNRFRIAIIAMLASGIRSDCRCRRSTSSVIAHLKWVESMDSGARAVCHHLQVWRLRPVLPGLLTIGAGFIFGLDVGTITVSIGSTRTTWRSTCT